MVYASVTGFGQTGPLARKPGYNTIAQGMSGLMSLTGMPGDPPTRVGGSVSDVAASYMVMLTAFLAEVIVLEASLSFLGLGVVEPTPAWGVMLRDFAGQYAEAAGVRHFSDKFGACHPAHPRLNDRVFNAEQIA